jgi:hypothetical protein
LKGLLLHQIKFSAASGGELPEEIQSFLELSLDAMND